MVRVGINGFGRIGRQVMRQALDFDDIEIVAVNDLWGVATFAHLLRYDSNYGYFPAEVEIMEDGLLVDGRAVRFTSHRNPADIPWGELGVDIVVESTGFFRDRDKAALHLEAGAKKVIISAPAKQPDITIVAIVTANRPKKSAFFISLSSFCIRQQVPFSLSEYT